jgi:uncharacterized protein (DUF2252 family)
MTDRTTLPSVAASKAAGRALREAVPRSSHAVWRPPRRGRDIIALLKATDRGRIPALVPIRYGRMLHSPFAFLRGAAAIMASDLAGTPASGVRVQACGDAHLMNFGGFATPERHVIFDVNDFDETLPAPWEWDVKRLAASVTVAARHLELAKPRCAEATRAAVAAYRDGIALYAPMGALERWYQRIDATEVAELHLAARRREADAPPHPVTEHLFPKFVEAIGGARRLKEAPPLIFHPRKGDRTIDHIRQFVRQYRKTLPADRRALLERYELVDVVIKVVGVGSVGLRCLVALLMARDDDALFLQFKEARASVLEPYAGRSRYRNHGERVVEGQRLMQSASDIFLGWSRISDLRADFYVRQLRDRKTTADVDLMGFRQLVDYVRHCGRALARAHAKAGDASAISGYVGSGEAFDDAAVRFAAAYADQTEADFATLERAAKAGRIPVEDA